MGSIATINATILSGASLSDAVKIGDSEVNDGSRSPDDFRLFGIVMPAAWTAANITFQSSYDGGTTWSDVLLDGVEYVYTATAGKDNNVDLQRFSCIPMVRLRSGTAAVPVNQAGGRVVTLILRSV